MKVWDFLSNNILVERLWAVASLENEFAAHLMLEFGTKQIIIFQISGHKNWLGAKLKYG